MPQYYNQPQGLDPLKLLQEQQRLEAMSPQGNAGSSLLGAALPLASKAMLQGLGGPQTNFAGGQQALNLAAASGMRSGPTNATAAMIPTAQSAGNLGGPFGGGSGGGASPYFTLPATLFSLFGK